MNWIASLALFAVALAGAGLHEGLGARLRQHMPLVLAFGGAFLIGLIFTHLAPEAYAFGPAVGYWVLVGFFVQIVLEYLSQGVEHGHVHPPEANTRVPWGVFFSLCLHAFLESMPLAGHGEMQGHAHDHDHHHGHIHVHEVDTDMPLLIGLALHKLPVALVLMSLLTGLSISRLRVWLLMMVFGAMPGLGMWTYAQLLGQEGASAFWTEGFPMAAHGVLIGILLHISTTILFETADGHRFNAVKMGITVTGLALSVLVGVI